MSRLPLNVPMGADETPASLASRLAARNGPSAREFCRHIGFTFQQVVDGVDAAIRKLATLAGVGSADLTRNAIRKAGDEYHLRGERLVRPAMRRDRVHACPECLAQDISSSTYPPHLAVHGRVQWLVASIRTCPIHGRALVEVARSGTPGRVHDFTATVRDVLPRLNDLVSKSIDRRVSPLELYLLARLRGETDTSGWLDRLPFHAAAKTCEMLGAVSLFGRRANLKRLTDSEWHAAGGAGFEIAKDGERGITGFLSRLEDTYDYSRAATEGPQAIYGRVYQWLAFHTSHSGYDALRDVIATRVFDVLPLGPGEEVFGRRVDRRVLHSIRSASLEIEEHPKRLRKVLEAAGLVRPDQAHQPDNRVVFSADAARETLDRAKGALALKEVERHLNAPRVHARLLLDRGFIRPFIVADARFRDHLFSRRDLDAFLQALVQGARPVENPSPSQVVIPHAAKRACCSAAEIVQLILDRKLAWTGLRSGVEGFLSVLVDLEEIRSKVRGNEIDGSTARDLEKILGTTTGVVKALIDGGHLATQTVTNPINRCPTVIVPNQAVAAFRSRYVSLFNLAKERGRHFRKLRTELRDRGIKPAPELDGVPASFYRREDIP